MFGALNVIAILINMTNFIKDELRLGLNECFSDEDVSPFIKKGEDTITIREFLIRASLGKNWELLREINLN